MSTLQGGKNAISNKEFLDTIARAKESHRLWIGNLKRIVDEMNIYPIQTNGTKCAFGHFYNAINVTYPSIKNDWEALGKIHMEFHSLGDNVLEAVKSKKTDAARAEYLSVLKLSEQIYTFLDKIAAEVEKQTSNGVVIFQGGTGL